MSDELKAAAAAMGRVGGRSRSEAKVKAGRQNMAKARAELAQRDHMGADGWVRAAVGCYWSKGPYRIATVDWGHTTPRYELTHDRQLLGEYGTIDAAKRAARIHSGTELS